MRTKLKERKRNLVLRENSAGEEFRDFLEDLGIPFKWRCFTTKHVKDGTKEWLALVTITCDILLYRQILIELKRLYKKYDYKPDIWFLESGE